MNLGIKVKIVGSQSMMRYARFLTDGEKQSILRKLGAKFKFLTLQNFGFTGTARPSAWKPLTPKYAKRVKRSVATLELSGDLMRSLRVSAPSNDSIEVFTDNEYAEAHQNGATRAKGGNLPARPFFPIDSAGNATARTQRVLETTAVQEIERFIRLNTK